MPLTSEQQQALEMAQSEYNKGDDCMKKSEQKVVQFYQFSRIVIEHINYYVVPQYGDFPDKTIAKFTPEKIQGKLEAYVDRIGKSSRGPEDALRDCLKIAHFACYLYAILKHGDAQADLF